MNKTSATLRHPVSPQWLTYVVLTLLLGGLLGAVWYQLSRDAVLPIEEVQFTGQFENLNAAQMAERVLPNVEGNFFTLNVDEIHQQVISLPWVSRVWVDRIWPNILRVRVEEQRPVASWNERGLINANAEVFVEAPAEAGLLKLYGPETEKQRMINKVPVFAGMLNDAGLQVTELDVDERLAWKMLLDNGVKVMVGRKDVELRLRRFVKVYRHILAQKQQKLAQVDLRYANGLAVQWKTAGQV